VYAELIHKLHTRGCSPPPPTHTHTHMYARRYVASDYRVSGASTSTMGDTYVDAHTCGDGNQCAITCRVIYN